MSSDLATEASLRSVQASIIEEFSTMQGAQKLFPSALPAQKATKKSGLKSQNKKAGNKKGQKKFMAQLVDSTEEQATEFKYQ
jgi:hypothetical protein